MGWSRGEEPEHPELGYYYAPKVARSTLETSIERHPDKLRSASRICLQDNGPELIWVMEVRGLGVITMRATSSPITGRMIFQGLAAFSSDMLLFGLEAEPGAPQ